MNQAEVKKITEYIFINAESQKADLALIFGTRHQEPLLKVFELYKNNFVSKILLSGGINKTTEKNEASEMANNLIKMGVKKDDLILENKSTNSLENILSSIEKIEKYIGFNKIKKILLVVKHYHSRRALMTAKKHFPKTVDLIPIAYEIYGFTKNNWHQSKIGRKKVSGEVMRITKYLANGDIEEL
ncbi:YdcF family protein [Patescibacteria group bacterium]